MQDSCATNSEQQNIVVEVERPYTSIGQVKTCTALACFWAVYFTAGLEVQRIASTDREKVFHTVVKDWLGASRAPAERNGKKVAPTVLNDSLGKNTRDTLSLKMRIRRQPKRPAKACIKVRGVGCTPAASLPQTPGKRKREIWLRYSRRVGLRAHWQNHECGRHKDRGPELLSARAVLASCRRSPDKLSRVRPEGPNSAILKNEGRTQGKKIVFRFPVPAEERLGGNDVGRGSAPAYTRRQQPLISQWGI